MVTALLPVDPPPITVSRAGLAYPQDYGGRMAEAWEVAWRSLRRGAWVDAVPLAAHVADLANIEVVSARSLLRQAARRRVIEVKYELRGEPLRIRAAYRAGSVRS